VSLGGVTLDGGNCPPDRLVAVDIGTIDYYTPGRLRDKSSRIEVDYLSRDNDQLQLNHSIHLSKSPYTGQHRGCQTHIFETYYISGNKATPLNAQQNINYIHQKFDLITKLVKII
jgi:hypothetical protein